MRTVQEAKHQRKQALQVWKREQQLLLDIQASAPDRYEKPQLVVVGRARARYDRLNDFLKRMEINKKIAGDFQPRVAVPD